MPYRSNIDERAVILRVQSRKAATCPDAVPIASNIPKRPRKIPASTLVATGAHYCTGQAKPYTDRYRPVLDDKCARDKGTGSDGGEAKKVCSAKRQDECKDNAPSKRTTGKPEGFDDCRRFRIRVLGFSPGRG